MGFWNRLFGRDRSRELKPQRLDYLNEALALERQGDYEAALTSYRLGPRAPPHHPPVLPTTASRFCCSSAESAIRPSGTSGRFWLARRAGRTPRSGSSTPISP